MGGEGQDKCGDRQFTATILRCGAGLFFVGDLPGGGHDAELGKLLLVIGALIITIGVFAEDISPGPDFAFAR